jgi:hypothetical protein
MSPPRLSDGCYESAPYSEDTMRELNQDLTKLFKLAMIVGFLSMIGSAAMAASNAGNAAALSEAAARATAEFTTMNAEFQSGVRTRIISDNDLLIDEPQLDQTTEEDTLLAASAVR